MPQNGMDEAVRQIAELKASLAEVQNELIEVKKKRDELDLELSLTKLKLIAAEGERDNFKAMIIAQEASTKHSDSFFTALARTGADD